jgi:hypothetical protein
MFLAHASGLAKAVGRRKMRLALLFLFGYPYGKGEANAPR